MSSQDGGGGRIAALDAVRGLAVVLMALDHARGAFDSAHFHGDSFVVWKTGDTLPVVSFLLRWLTHFCAPAFLFTMGCGIALLVASARQRGVDAAAIDRRLLRRGLLLMALDPLWMWWGFAPDIGQGIADNVVTGVQVLFALGAAMVAMIWLRRLTARKLAILGAVALLVCEALIGLVMWAEGVNPDAGRWPSPPTALLLSGGFVFGGRLAVLYPVLPWLPLTVLGFAFATDMRELDPKQIIRRAAGFSGLALVVFVVVRGLNGYGNLLLFREGMSPLQWLHVSKYPPSLSYCALELGLVGLALAVAVAARSWLASWAGNPLLVFGKAPLFFYVLHVHLLTGAALALGLLRKSSIAVSALAAVLVLLVLYPACRWFLAVKARDPGGWTRWFS